MILLGISAYYHDSAAAIFKDGEILCAVQEERFTRIKHDKTFPVNAIKYCLEQCDIQALQLDQIVFYEDSNLKFKRLKKTYVDFFPKTIPLIVKSLPKWLSGGKNSVANLISDFKEAGIAIDDSKLSYCEHHRSHAASAFFASPFSESAVLVMDGVGEHACTSIWSGKGNTLTKIRQIEFPNSLGLFYSTITAYLGFKVNSGEYKVMGLAPYGKPIYEQELSQLVSWDAEKTTYHLNMQYFDFPYSGRMFSSKLESLLGCEARNGETDLTQFHMDVAASLQLIIEKFMKLLAEAALEEVGSRNLCLAGGVALNCVSNGKLVKDLASLENIWIQPASGDAGGALGCVLNYYYEKCRKARPSINHDLMKGCYLGPETADLEIDKLIERYGCVVEKYDNDALVTTIAGELNSGKVIGWHQGRAEFGPRALGARSIIGDPRNESMQSKMNLKIKQRESFRPFAPSILYDKVSEYFELEQSSPYMLLVADIAEQYRIELPLDNEELFGIDLLKLQRSSLPAITHVDYSARIQTVDGIFNKKYYDLLNSFYSATGCPILINTSFNIRGEPIVLTAEDSFKCFMRTDMDVLVINNYVFHKEKQGEVKKDTLELLEYELD